MKTYKLELYREEVALILICLEFFEQDTDWENKLMFNTLIQKLLELSKQ
jgi:hypothetical protein